MNIHGWGRKAMVLFVLVSWPALTAAQSVTTKEEIAETIAVKNLTVNDNAISGEVVNRFPHPLRDVEVLVQYHWLWNDEFDPGKNPPGKSVYVKLDRDIPPAMSVPFTYVPETPLESVKQGRFMPEVSVAAFTVVVMPQKHTRF